MAYWNSSGNETAGPGLFSDMDDHWSDRANSSVGYESHRSSQLNVTSSSSTSTWSSNGSGRFGVNSGSSHGSMLGNSGGSSNSSSNNSIHSGAHSDSASGSSHSGYRSMYHSGYTNGEDGTYGNPYNASSTAPRPMGMYLILCFFIKCTSRYFRIRLRDLYYYRLCSSNFMF